MGVRQPKGACAMTLLNAPEFDQKKETARRNLLVGSGVALFEPSRGAQGLEPAIGGRGEGLRKGLWHLLQRCRLAAASRQVQGLSDRSLHRGLLDRERLEGSGQFLPCRFFQAR